ncbi:6336_t:CDS:2, partial [Dentiscutata erythropus]
NGRFGFADMIFGDVNYSIIELKYVNILGLIEATKNDWNVSPCTNDLYLLGYPKFIRLVLARKLKSRKMDEKDGKRVHRTFQESKTGIYTPFGVEGKMPFFGQPF